MKRRWKMITDKIIKTEGVMTVEASLVVPMVIFIVILLLYSIFFIHDQAATGMLLDQSAEDILWNRLDREKTSEEVLFMADLTEYSVAEDKTLLAGAVHGAFSMRTATAKGEGRLEIKIYQSRLWAGFDAFKISGQSRVHRMDYRQDWLKSVFLDNLGSSREK